MVQYLLRACAVCRCAVLCIFCRRQRQSKVVRNTVQFEAFGFSLADTHDDLRTTDTQMEVGGVLNLRRKGLRIDFNTVLFTIYPYRIADTLSSSCTRVKVAMAMVSCTKRSSLLVICYRLHVWLMYVSTYEIPLGIGLKR